MAKRATLARYRQQRIADVTHEIRLILMPAPGPLTVEQIREALGPHRPGPRYVVDRLRELVAAGEVVESRAKQKLGIGRYRPAQKATVRVFEMRRATT